jgi:hypothetical protein
LLPREEASMYDLVYAQQNLMKEMWYEIPV